MSDQPARAHNHLSNRARVRSVLERKPIFKSVLENPFQIKWPSVPINVQNLFLARLMATLENIPSRVHASRPAVRKGVYSPTVNPSLPGTSAQASDDVECGNLPAPDEAPIDYSSSDPSQPQHLIIGINQVTRALEHQLQFSRRRITLCTSSQRVDQPDVPSSNMAIVFVCCADLDPPALVDHIPYLVAGCNSAKDIPQAIRLVPLPKGSEATISQTIGLRRAAVIGIDHASPLAAIFQDLLGSVPVVGAPWLCLSDAKSAQQLVPTHIKQLRTTAPKNMKVAKEQRSKARAAAKTKSQGFPRSVRRKPRMTLTTGAADTT
ncbi:hypothetical protein PAXINDRAFT_124530 [Paxillus involutus ATCC 200175]|nr:hypothetical protein PAXINDRAFT_124530 [Paxillus involutus ATCC 200175]